MNKLDLYIALQERDEIRKDLDKLQNVTYSSDPMSLTRREDYLQGKIYALNFIIKLAKRSTIK